MDWDFRGGRPLAVGHAEQGGTAGRVQPATVLQKGIERKSAVADTDRHEERGFPQ